MSGARAFAAIATAVEAERARVATIEREHLVAERAALAREEIRASVRLAGAILDAVEVRALLERGIALGGRPLATYVVAADYADAARYAARLPVVGPRQPYLRLAEVVELHARATRRTPEARPGAWRTRTLATFPSGAVAPPAWRIPGDIAAYVDRIASGPPERESTLRWLADSHERFERIHPFEEGNGRAGRLVLNLLLHRCGYPPFAVRDRDANAYAAALRRADTRDPWPLATLLGRCVLASLVRLSAASPSDGLAELTAFAAGSERDALYKAAQRGRLRIVRRNGSLLTTQAWIDAYRSSRFSREAVP